MMQVKQGEAEVKSQQFKQAQVVLKARDRKLLEFLNDISLSVESIDKVKFFIETENKIIADSIESSAASYLNLTDKAITAVK